MGSYSVTSVLTPEEVDVTVTKRTTDQGTQYVFNFLDNIVVLSKLHVEDIVHVTNICLLTFGDTCDVDTRSYHGMSRHTVRLVWEQLIRHWRAPDKLARIIEKHMI